MKNLKAFYAIGFLFSLSMITPVLASATIPLGVYQLTEVKCDLEMAPLPEELIKLHFYENQVAEVLIVGSSNWGVLKGVIESKNSNYSCLILNESIRGGEGTVSINEKWCFSHQQNGQDLRASWNDADGFPISCGSGRMTNVIFQQK